VKVSYGEGLATHTGPESCVTIREGWGEALTGDCIGQPLSRERASPGMPTLFIERKAKRTRALCEHGYDPARSETLACADAP
jgi:hypothetical protein